MKKRFTKLMAALALLVFMTPTMVGWGQSTTYNFSSIPTSGWSTSGGSQTINSVSWTYSSSTYIGVSNGRIQVGSKNNPQTSAWTIQTPISSFGTGKKIIAVSITAYTTATTATYDVSVGGNSVNSGSLTTSSATYTANNLNVTSGNIVVTMTGSSTSKAMYLTNVSVTYEDAGGGNTPSITANDVNITYDAVDGEIAYTINNPVDGGSIAASVTSDWLTVNGNAQSTTSGSFEFLCDANPSANARTATVTLTYTYSTNETVTKDVTVTQAGNPNAFDNISDIDSENTHYKVKGTVLAVSARAFVLGDGTGYVYYYNGYTAPSVAVNDKKIVEGTTTSYGHVIQFNNSATITATETSNYNNTPAATVITAIPDYTSGLHLSDYFQFEGTLTKAEGATNYYVGVGEGQIQISYQSSVQQAAMNALLNKTVRVKGYFSGINSSNYFSVILESVEEVANPSIGATPSPFTAPSYVVGTAEPTYNVLTVNGSNLTANISLTLNANSDFEMSTDLNTWSSSLTLTQTNGSVTNEEVAIRLKAGLAKGNYAGTVTLSSTDAQNVVVDLSGSVTGQTYAINIDDEITGGTIAADLTTAEAGATVTLTATPDAAYNFGSWIVEDEDENPIEVTGNQFVMPDSKVYVTATFTPKDTYAITCIVTPNDAAHMEATPASAYEGQTVTLSYTAETGYTLSTIVVTKTSDNSATDITPVASGDDFTFTMPGYAVTATATFISDTYYGSFLKFTGSAMEEGDYILVYSNKAMNNDNTTTSKKLGATGVVTTGNIITDPSRSIVWHIAPIGTEGKWTIYNAYVNKYVNASSSSSTDITLVDNASYSNGAKWSVTIDGDNNTYDFSSLTTSRALRYNNSVFGHYATSNGGPLTLYKYTVLTERTITFNGNGGTYNNETTYTQTVYDGIAENLDANKFTKAGSAFIGWSTTANGEVEYADEASITVNGDLTLYARWATPYTAMVDNQIVGGTVKVNGEDNVQVAAGTEMTLTYTSNTSYAFSAWNVYKDGDETIKVTVTGNTFEMPEYDVIVSASFVEVTTYSLVTNVNQIVSGKHYIIASGTNGSVKVMAGQNSNNRASVVVTATEGVIPETEGIYEFVINGPFTFNKKDCYTIYDKNASSTGYLYAASSSSNYLRTKAELDANGKWNIEIDGNSHAATVKAQGKYTHNWMRNNSSLFSCYESGQSDIYLYVKDNDHNLEYYGSDITISDETLASNSVVVGNGSVVTFNGTNDNPANLIIEDGGQLITNNSVNATLEKEIVKAANWGTGDYTAAQWYFIASPVYDFSTTTIVAGTANTDLYRYDEGSSYWFNAQSGDNTFSALTRGQGYLYASKADKTLEFAGAMLATNTADVAVDLSFAYNGTASVKGFNLVGNPFTRNITSSDMKLATTTDKTTTYDDVTAYYMVENGAEITASSADIKPGRGFMVQATKENQQLVFNHTTSKAETYAKPSTIIVEAGNAEFMDRALVQIGGGNTLRKMTINDQVSHVYVINDGKDYAAATVDELKGEMPVIFDAAQDGQYTISVSTDNVEMGYMHLVDMKNGMDIDLMATPSYTFEAKANDNAGRFRLLFRATGVEENTVDNEEGFAFVSNGQIVVTGEGTLRIVDMLGRTVGSYNSSERISTEGLTSGVYVLQLIGGEKTMTQKIVVR